MSLFRGGFTGLRDTAPVPTSGPSGPSQEARQTIADLQDRLDRLTLVTQAMWELVQEKTGLKESDLMEHVQNLDLRDGVADGKVTRTVSRCPQCQRTMSPRHQRCLYCGHEKLINGVFDSL
jgi:ribosomal protein S27AE